MTQVVYVRQLSKYWRPGPIPVHIDVSESVQRLKLKNAKMKELFYKGTALADNHSLAYYNIQEGDTIETCSNPLWLCLVYITAEKFKERYEQYQDYPTNKCYFCQSRVNANHICSNPQCGEFVIHKGAMTSLFTVVGKFTNSKTEAARQPDPMWTIDEVLAIQGVGARARFIISELYDDYMAHEGRDSPSPLFDSEALTAFIERRGFPGPKQRKPPGTPRRAPAAAAPVVNCQIQGCNLAAAISCAHCPEDHRLMCEPCSDDYHIGALRQAHVRTPIAPARAGAVVKPVISTDYIGGLNYCPKPRQTPFALLATFHEAASRVPAQHSLDEDELKELAQPHTDADLYYRNPALRFAAIDGLETTLMAKDLVRKEAEQARYSLLPNGRLLAQGCSNFIVLYDMFVEKHIHDKYATPFFMQPSQNPRVRVICIPCVLIVFRWSC